MHTLMIIAAGFVLLGVCLLVGKLTGRVPSAAKAFIPLWFVGAAINLWVGVSQAGYTVAEELPIFVVVFAVPAIAAWLIYRRVI